MAAPFPVEAPNIRHRHTSQSVVADRKLPFISSLLIPFIEQLANDAPKYSGKGKGAI